MGGKKEMFAAFLLQLLAPQFLQCGLGQSDTDKNVTTN
jgi:hypothetical protein